MKRLTFALILALFTLTIGISQDNPQTNKTDEAGVRIFEASKDCVVSLETTMTLVNGFQFIGSGTGFFVDKNGLLVTNAHVVKEKNDEFVLKDLFGEFRSKITSYSYWVTLTSKNRKYRAELVGWDHSADLALMKVSGIDPQDYSAVKLGNPQNLREGERVYTMGTPFGLSNTITSGIVSGVHRVIGLNYLEDFIQTDAPINPGNSGGPLINAEGEVVGINSAYIKGSSVGFSISVRLLRLEELKQGEVKLNWFGAEALLMNFPRTGNPGFQDLAYLNNETGIDNVPALILLAQLTNDNHAVVNQVDQSRDANGSFSPAKKAGLQKGDLITKVNGKTVKNGMDIRFIILETPLGKEFEVEFIRATNGIRQEMKVTLKLAKKEVVPVKEY